MTKQQEIAAIRAAMPSLIEAAAEQTGFKPHLLSVPEVVQAAQAAGFRKSPAVAIIARGALQRQYAAWVAQG